MSQVTGLVGGAAKFFEGKKMYKQASEAIDNFKWQELDSNPYDAVQVSTAGADLMTEGADTVAATSVDAMAGGGARGLANLGRVQAYRTQVDRESAANIDQQYKAIQSLKAADEVQRRAMIENRQSNELQGYGQMMNVGMGMKHQGINDIYNTMAATEEQILKAAGMVATGGASAAAGGAPAATGK